jgi:TrmH family RNA methyltransferase
MERITSRNNPKIKQVRALQGRKERQASGFFVIEGIRHVGEAVEAAQALPGAPALQAIYYSPELLTSDFAHRLIAGQSERGLPCYPVAAEVFESLADKENPQGILAVAEAPRTPLSSLGPAAYPWVVAVVTPQDPGNVGAILRTIDAVGASALVLLDGGVDPYHPGAVRASMGSLFWYPPVSASFPEFEAWAKENCYMVYGASAHGAEDYRTVERYTPPLVLLLGSEREGLTSKQRAACGRLLRLPMQGRASSLNLAVAAGVLLYSMLERMASNL